MYPLKERMQREQQPFVPLDDGKLILEPDSDQGDSLGTPGRTQRQRTPSATFLRNLPDEDVPPDEEEATSNFLQVFTSSCTQITPKTHAQAMSSPEAAEWRKAEIKEYKSHVKNGTVSEPCELPPAWLQNSPSRLRLQKQALGHKESKNCPSCLPHEARD